VAGIDVRLGIGIVVGVAAIVLTAWGFRKVVQRARAQQRSVAGAVLASMLVSPFVVLLLMRDR